MNNTPIEWTHWSVNPFKMRMPDGTLINVCVHKSDGCRFCYAEGIVRRWWKKAWGEFPGYTAALLKLGTPVLVEDELAAVFRLSHRIIVGKANPEENKIFWNDMTDEFLEFWPDEFIDKLFAVRALTPNLVHQVLTKRADRMRAYMANCEREALWMNATAEVIQTYMTEGRLNQQGDWSILNRREPWIPLPNVHLGTSVEDQKTADERIPLLMETPAAVRWISAEPLLGLIDLESVPTMEGSIDWLVVGGESGPKARPMNPEWARSLRDQCVAAGVPFFFKQWGAWCPEIGCSGKPCSYLSYGWPDVKGQVHRVGKKAAGRLLDGRTWDEFPNTKGEANATN